MLVALQKFIVLFGEFSLEKKGLDYSQWSSYPKLLSNIQQTDNAIVLHNSKLVWDTSLF
jgi:hypothetical protein